MSTFLRCILVGLRSSGSFPYTGSPRLLKFSWPLVLWSAFVQVFVSFGLYLGLSDEVLALRRKADVTVIDVISVLSSATGKSSMQLGNLLLLIKSRKIAKCLNTLPEQDLSKKKVVAEDRGILLLTFFLSAGNMILILYLYSSYHFTTLRWVVCLPAALMTTFGYHCLSLLFAFVTLALSKDLQEAVDGALVPPPSVVLCQRASRDHSAVSRFTNLEKQLWKVRCELDKG